MKRRELLASAALAGALPAWALEGDAPAVGAPNPQQRAS
jgi:hypothetical protein